MLFPISIINNIPTATQNRISPKALLTIYFSYENPNKNASFRAFVSLYAII